MLTFLLLLAVASINWVNCGEDIMDLSAYEVDEFKSELENYDALFINFYAPYCGHCKAIKPDFRKAATVLKNEDPVIPLAMVDCTSGTGTLICNEFNIGNYPSLKLFKQGEFFKDYDGASRDADSMIEWLRKNAKTVSKRFSSFTELDAAIAKVDEPVVIGIFQNNDDALVEQWLKATRKVKSHWNYRNVEFFHIFEDYATGSSSNLKSIGLKTENRVLRAPAIVLHRPSWLHNKMELADVVYEVESKEDLGEWISRKAFGLVLWRTRDNEEELKPPLIVAYYVVDFKRNHKFTHFWRNRMMKAAKENPELRFAISNSHTFRKQLRRQNLEPPKEEEDPLVVGYDKFGTMTVMREQFTLENFDKFIQDFKKGDVVPYLKSLEPPNDNEEKDVKIAVGANFHELVTHNKKDVFICFYAPWCKHSQELEPTWDELGRQMKDEPNIDIVRMDAIANEVPNQFEIPQYPTVYFVPSDTKKPKRYNRGRLIHEFVLYLAEHSTKEMKNYARDGSKRTEGKEESEKSAPSKGKSKTKSKKSKPKSEL